VWTKKPITPIVIANKRSLYMQLDVYRTVRNLLDFPSFWRSEEFRKCVANPTVIALDYGFFVDELLDILTGNSERSERELEFVVRERELERERAQRAMQNKQPLFSSRFASASASSTMTSDASRQQHQDEEDDDHDLDHDDHDYDFNDDGDGDQVDSQARRPAHNREDRASSNSDDDEERELSFEELERQWEQIKQEDMEWHRRQEEALEREFVHQELRDRAVERQRDNLHRALEQYLETTPLSVLAPRLLSYVPESSVLEFVMAFAMDLSATVQPTAIPVMPDIALDALALEHYRQRLVAFLLVAFAQQWQQQQQQRPTEHEAAAPQILDELLCLNALLCHTRAVLRTMCADADALSSLQHMLTAVVQLYASLAGAPISLDQPPPPSTDVPLPPPPPSTDVPLPPPPPSDATQPSAPEGSEQERLQMLATLSARVYRHASRQQGASTLALARFVALESFVFLLKWSLMLTEQPLDRAPDARLVADAMLESVFPPPARLRRQLERLLSQAGFEYCESLNAAHDRVSGAAAAIPASRATKRKRPKDRSNDDDDSSCHVEFVGWYLRRKPKPATATATPATEVATATASVPWSIGRWSIHDVLELLLSGAVRETC